MNKNGRDDRQEEAEGKGPGGVRGDGVHGQPISVARARHFAA